MRSKSWLIVVFAILGSLSSVLVWALDFTPGKYEITTVTEMSGMPGAIPPQTIVQCLTKQDPVPDQSVGGGCTLSKMKTKGNTVSWTMSCNQQGYTSEGSGSMTYDGDTFHGTFTTKLGPQAQNMTVTTKLNGKRIGDCQ